MSTQVTDNNLINEEEELVPQGVLKIKILDCILNKLTLKKPYFIITLGDQKKQTRVSEEQNWSEGLFEFQVDFHAQLFSTLQLDLYEQNKWLSDTHIGRTEFRLCLLETMPPSFTNYYEIWDKTLSSGASSSIGQETAGKNNLGILHLHLAYRYQSIRQSEDHDHHVVLKEIDDKLPKKLSDLLLSTLSTISSNTNNKNEHDQNNSIDNNNTIINRSITTTKMEINENVNNNNNNNNLDIIGDDDDDLKLVKEMNESNPDMNKSNEDEAKNKDKTQVYRTIGKLLAHFGQGLELSNFQIISGYTLLERFYGQLLPKDQQHPSKEIVMDLKQVELAGHFWKFAMASYGWKGLHYLGRGNGLFTDSWRNNSDALSVVESLSILEQDLLDYNFKSTGAFRPSYFIAHDRSTNSIVLSIRGTMSVSDTLTDLVCIYEPWRGGIVHSGMKESAVWFLKMIAPQLLMYCKQYATTGLYVVGHSLGAATASILTILLMDYIDEFKQLTNGDDEFTLKCYGYGPACGLSLELAELYKENIYSFVFADDIVSKLSYGSMMTVKELIIASVEASKLVGPKSLGDDRWKQAFERIDRVRQRCLKSKDNPRLFVSGQIYQFWLEPLSDHDTRVVIKKTNAIDVSSEIIVRRSVITDHLPSTFDMACKRARETLMLQQQKTQQNENNETKHSSIKTLQNSHPIQEPSISTKDLWNEFSTLKLQQT
ncbi:unnamed protein product [Cunninghamella blakesleeana]